MRGIHIPDFSFVKNRIVLILQLTEQEFREAISKEIISALASQSKASKDELISRKETASYLKVTLPTLRSWEAKGYLRPVRIGNRVFFKKSDLLK